MPGAYRTADATASARRAEALTYSDTTVIENTRALFVGAAGDVKVSMVEGGDVTFKAVAAGSILPIQVTKVWSAGTTVAAGAILALY
jgi:hypothetical protein